MIIAVPMSRNRLARHFTKAGQIAFYDGDHQLLALLDNPAQAGGCAAKKAMLNLIKAKGTDLVLVDEIGERMLGKLLACGAAVSRCDSRAELTAVLADCQAEERLLTSASQGRPSLNHAKKGGCGGGCGGHSHKAEIQTSLLSPVGIPQAAPITGFKKL
ncbi:hypothetical protein NFHSH190041_30380 [Shewanella sp. NFH-SH190041]|uniref:NifB/NifX family molybdenum-iron cluster-binding protein n=1 Tax=Shewanella sp. NFH-SH190041 TaxID=2950245 RepID=UPI0021C25D0D|nr:NifB/NifX family molybdenum-iron cluster-binding protein [Shewanella sp. NFH-SH190041]BDM65586.1 hypothetical protein NFHSH190041_30380 [Shewanella sp. NFH-SH190041]